MTAIVLPPLPPMTHYGGTATVVSPEWLRARDLEVVKCVLEAAAKFFRDNDSNLFWGSQAAEHTRALEFTHD